MCLNNRDNGGNYNSWCRYPPMTTMTLSCLQYYRIYEWLSIFTKMSGRSKPVMTSNSGYMAIITSSANTKAYFGIIFKGKGVACTIGTFYTSLMCFYFQALIKTEAKTNSRLQWYLTKIINIIYNIYSIFYQFFYIVGQNSRYKHLKLIDYKTHYSKYYL